MHTKDERHQHDAHVAAFARDPADRPASVREVVALRREVEALRARLKSLEGLVGQGLVGKTCA